MPRAANDTSPPPEQMQSRALTPAPAPPEPDPEPQFYRSVVDDAAALLEADEIKGVDRELSLLRVTLRDHMAAGNTDHRLMIKSIETITKIVSARYRMSAKKTEDLAASITAALEKITDLVWPGE